VRPGEANLVPADLGDTPALGEAPYLAGEPAKARRVAFFAVLEEHLEADADAKERDLVLLHPLPERVEEVGLAQ
jgi:hypothetical protein